MDVLLFTEWLNTILENELPNEVKAVNFNLYDDGQGQWSVELIGASSFDEEDPDWACDEVFTTRETAYEWEKEATWEEVLSEAIKAVEDYLQNEEYAKILKKYEGIGVGFVDGELVVVYKK